AGGLVILSGGLDSTVCMSIAARDAGTGAPAPLALTFDYGQRHRIELERAAAVAASYGSEHLVVHLDAGAWGGSALTDPGVAVPDAPGSAGSGEAIPVTYVPARNLIFLSVALGVAEARDLTGVYLGVNALDYSGYPDCRPEFVEAFRRVASVGQRRGIEGHPVEIRTPLIDLAKADIVRLGQQLGAPMELTWSCYRGGPAPCGRCDACALRAKGFAEACLADPALAASPPR
ncbi:MAG TPA: 7-cyano-7-deazaguanine synthase QueC, partial [Acidimicrobiales bacterium]|nr:7-cyano-7-deazaguanine synthase QueC [Acidimicrobiales bacterium]